MGVAAAGPVAAAQLCSELAQFQAIAVIQQPHREGWVVDGRATLQAAAHHLQRFTAAGQQQINRWEPMQRLGLQRPLARQGKPQRQKAAEQQHQLAAQ